MADEIRIATSVDVIELLEDGDSSLTAKQHHPAVKGSKGASNTINITDISVTGYSSGSPDYAQGDGGSLSISANTFVYIKNTGYKYDSGSLGAATTNELVITTATGGDQIASIPAGGSIVLQGLNDGLNFATSGADNIAVEYIQITE